MWIIVAPTKLIMTCREVGVTQFKFAMGKWELEDRFQEKKRAGFPKHVISNVNVMK